MRNTVTDKLLDELNRLRGLEYPAIGYSYFADIKGDGRNTRAIYTIVNERGGVTYSNMNRASPKERARAIRFAINAETR